MRQRSRTPNVPPIPGEGQAGRADDRGRRVDGLARFGDAVAADIQHDRPVGLVVRPEHVRDQTGVESYPTHARRAPAADPPPAPTPPPSRRTTPIQPSAPGTHPKGTGLAAPGPVVRRAVGDSMKTTCSAVMPMSCCQVDRSNSTDWAARSAPAASHSPIRRKMPSRSSTSPPSSWLPSSTPNSTRPPSAASRCTCEAMGTVSPPPNSSGSKNREYCRGMPASGRARIDPACQKTPASASDSWRWYQTAWPSRISTACKAPDLSPPGAALVRPLPHRRQRRHQPPTATPGPPGKGSLAGQEGARPT